MTSSSSLLTFNIIVICTLSPIISGIKALLLAPSALNRQPYIVNGVGNKVSFKVKSGPLSQVDLGIGKYFFELGAGKSNFEWS